MQLFEANLWVAACVLSGVWTSLWKTWTRFRMPYMQSAWNLCGYTCLTVLGVHALSEAQLLYGYGDMHRLVLSQKHALPTNGMMLYAQMQCAWYLCGLVTLWFDRRAKDYVAMCVHHVCVLVVISLIFYSQRIAALTTLVISLHDMSDILLHAAKLLRHLRCRAMVVDSMFVVFTCFFFVSRLILYPNALRWAIREGVDMSVLANQVMIAINFVLVGLHAYWFIIICYILVKFIRSGHVADDIRDDTAHDEYEGMQQKSCV